MDQQYLLTERVFGQICAGIRQDREKIIKYNPIGSPEEILLWMLLSVLVSLLSLSEQETPCFTGSPTAETYRQAIHFILENRRVENFDAAPHIEQMLS